MQIAYFPDEKIKIKTKNLGDDYLSRNNINTKQMLKIYVIY